MWEDNVCSKLEVGGKWLMVPGDEFIDSAGASWGAPMAQVKSLVEGGVSKQELINFLTSDEAAAITRVLLEGDCGLHIGRRKT